MDMIIDAENAILGRLASKVAKELLLGKNIAIVNAEKAVVSGNPRYSLEFFKGKISRGDPYKGPFYPRSPDRILKRVVRGMLPYKKFQGKKAYKRLHVFISVPEEFRGEKILKLKEVENRLEKKFISLGVLSEMLGAKKLW